VKPDFNVSQNRLIYTDENFPLPVVEALRDLGHDVLTAHEAGNTGKQIPDEDVLAFAIQEKRILLTLNRKHFIRLHREIAGHSGIVVCTFDPQFTDQGKRIHAALEAQSEMADQLIRVNRPAT
jgi:predicted nuclease of predicted toxin-antitoxin system